jgi:hypothetical protein
MVKPLELYRILGRGIKDLRLGAIPFNHNTRAIWEVTKYGVPQ